MAYYFRVIKTSSPNEDMVRAEHELKLNNFLNYGWADVTVSEKQKVEGKRVEIESQSTGVTVKNHDFIIVTTLCCETGEERREDKK